MFLHSLVIFRKYGLSSNDHDNKNRSKIMCTGPNALPAEVPRYLGCRVGSRVPRYQGTYQDTKLGTMPRTHIETGAMLCHAVWCDMEAWGGQAKSDTCGVRTHALSEWRLEPLGQSVLCNMHGAWHEPFFRPVWRSGPCCAGAR